MYKCHCEKMFETQPGLNAHQVSHKTEGRYSVSRKKHTEMYVCRMCGTAFPYSKGTMNKFCSTACSAKSVWEHKSKPRIEQGLGGNLHRYLKETRGDMCEVCGQSSVHNDNPLTLQVDHIDGNSDNNVLSNVRLLCPNCHTQTENWGSKGKGNRYKKITKRNQYLREYKTGP